MRPNQLESKILESQKPTNKQKTNKNELPQNNIIRTKANRKVWNTCYILQIYQQRNNYLNIENKQS